MIDFDFDTPDNSSLLIEKHININDNSFKLQKQLKEIRSSKHLSYKSSKLNVNTLLETNVKDANVKEKKVDIQSEKSQVQGKEMLLCAVIA